MDFNTTLILNFYNDYSQIHCRSFFMQTKVKKGIIFTASTGGGHNQAANSLKEQLKSDGMDAEIIDVFRDNNMMLELFIEDAYSAILNFVPSLYGGLYKISGRPLPNTHLKRLFKRLLRKKMLNYLKIHKPDFMVSTHPLFVHTIAELKSDGYTNVPCISVVTDLGVHPFYRHPLIDAYITSHEHTKKSLINLGISSNRIFVYGIPVKKSFYEPPQSIRCESDVFTVLLMGGSLGSKKLHHALKSLTQSTRKLVIHVVCGHDKTTLNAIKKDFSEVPVSITIHLYGFVNNVGELMDKSDVLISKPGGLTVTEAIHKQIPLVIPFFLRGQEEENTTILENEGLAVYIGDIDTLDQMVEQFITNPATLSQIRSRMQKISISYSLDKIGLLCSRLTSQSIA